MNRDLILPGLNVGKAVILWEGRDIGSGKVLRFALMLRSQFLLLQREQSPLNLRV